MPDANGIAVSRSGDALFVAGWHSIYRVELTSRRARALQKPPQVASGCFDGLYVDGGDLVGVQNCVHSSGRVVRLQLDAAQRRITRATVLESYNPLFDGVTTAAAAGDTLYFVANVQLRKLGTAARFEPLRILALPIRP